MKALTQLRPSNLILLAAAPFIVYLFATSPNYQRSLIAILGVEEEPGPLVWRFLALALVFALGLLYPIHAVSGRPRRGFAIGGGIASAILAALLAQVDLAPFVNAVVANSVDAYTSTLIVPATTPRQLTPEALGLMVGLARQALLAYAAISLALLLVAVLLDRDRSNRGRATWAAIGALALPSFAGLLYLLLICPAPFASGLMTTLRAAILAYVMAAILGLGLAALQQLKAGRRTIPAYAIASAILLAGAALLFMQPRESYVLVGNLTGRVAIVAGTPSSLIEAVRFGRYEGATSDDVKLRTTPNAARAVELIAAGGEVTGALLPAADAMPGQPVLWRAEILPDRWRIPAIALGIAGFLLGLLTFGAWRHRLHPVAAGAEFFVDTIRGIPMLVIILYIGLPLGGSIREVTSGTIDLPNLARGIIAMAIAYSAYLAEIFRAGIEAIPRGQVEAARSLGMSSWQVGHRIVLPQAVRLVIPALSNEFIAILKDTSLLSILSVRDVTQRMREFQSASFLPFAPFNAAAILYVVLTLAAASALKSIERRYDVKKRH